MIIKADELMKVAERCAMTEASALGLRPGAPIPKTLVVERCNKQFTFTYVGCDRDPDGFPEAWNYEWKKGRDEPFVLVVLND